MITFKQFLNETTVEKYSTDLEEIVDLIQQDCQPFLREAGDYALFRGFRGRRGLTDDHGHHIGPIYWLKATPRTDRRPLDSYKLAHDLMDDWFEKNYGVRARSEGVFCAPRQAQAASYGRAFYVFPIGNFKVLWASHDVAGTSGVKDTASLSDSIYRFAETVEPDKQADVADRVMTNHNHWHEGNVKKAVQSDAEITLICDKYYAVACGPNVHYTDLISGKQLPREE